MKLFLTNILLISFLSISDDSIFSENYIDKNSFEIKTIVKEKFKSFKLNTDYVNNSYKYLKYEDRVREITVLFFLQENDQCHMIRVMSDYSNFNLLQKELDANYKKIDKKLWQYQANGKTCDVTLVESEWFFTISIKEKK